jgi:hypothetical protein
MPPAFESTQMRRLTVNLPELALAEPPAGALRTLVVGPTSEELEAVGYPLDAPVLLLLHSFDSSSLEWRRTYPRLAAAAGVPVVAVDLVGVRTLCECGGPSCAGSDSGQIACQAALHCIMECIAASWLQPHAVSVLGLLRVLMFQRRALWSDDENSLSHTCHDRRGAFPLAQTATSPNNGRSLLSVLLVHRSGASQTTRRGRGHWPSAIVCCHCLGRA